MNCKYVCAGLGLLVILLLGCQSAQSPRDRDKQANAYIEQAQAYESQGNLVEALEQFKLAQTIAPDDPVANDGVNRLEKQLNELAETHYQAGLRFRDKGKWDLAKREFLKALRYQPEHERAAAMLQQRQPKQGRKYITHRIASGESISKLALKYYGDFKKYHHIANFNNMTDATRVRVGQRILIPEIDGVSIDDLIRVSGDTSTATVQPRQITGDYSVHQIQPGESLSIIAKNYYGDFSLFRVIADYNGINDPTSVKVGQIIKVPRLEEASAPDTASVEPSTEAPYQPEQAEAEPVEVAVEASTEPLEALQPEEMEPVDQVVAYRNAGIALFNDQRYEDAIVELQKVLSAAPDDAIATDYISRSYVQLGKSHLAADRLNEAKTAFTTALDYNLDCEACQDALMQLRVKEAEVFRSAGERHLRGKAFDQAIDALERAVALNPDDALAADLLFQTHYQKALNLYEEQDYLSAKTGFERAAAVKPDCNDCSQYIQSSMDAYKELHYNEGIAFFGQEDLNNAIVAWQKVVAVDPGYKDVQQNLKKAKLLNERLERIRQSSTE
jgi:tetratricopeptide (TPR) repeat protein